MPTTTIPSPSPSIAGWVATVTATAVATGEVDENTVEDYATDIAEYYGVAPDEVTVTTTYGAGGSMQVTIPDDISEVELVDAITNSIAESLGVHPSDVDVVVDMETGEVEYTVSSDNYLDAATNQFDLGRPQVQDAIAEAIQEAVPSVTIEEIEVDEEVNATLEFIVDANDASRNLEQAAYQSEQLLSDFGDVRTESNTFMV